MDSDKTWNILVQFYWDITKRYLVNIQHVQVDGRQLDEVAMTERFTRTDVCFQNHRQILDRVRIAEGGDVIGGGWFFLM